jgi:hypothetical protein
MAAVNGCCRSFLAPRSGITPAAWCRSVMGWFATLRVSSSRRLFCALISTRTPTCSGQRPKRWRGQRGRTLLKGRALPKLSAVLKNKKTVWTSVVVSQLYNAQQRRLLVATGTALWYHIGIAPVPNAADASWHIDALQASIRWVLVRDPSGEREPAAFLGTDLDAQPATILGWFVSRWRVETTFEEVRAHLGVETQKRPISADRAALHPLHSFTPM